MIKTTPLSPDTYKSLIAQLLGMEGYNKSPYYDSVKPNHLVTIGQGFNIEGDTRTRGLVFAELGLNLNRFNTATNSAALIAKEKVHIKGSDSN